MLFEPFPILPRTMLTLQLVFMLSSIGRNITHLIDRGDEMYCFRLHRDRVYYVR